MFNSQLICMLVALLLQLGVAPESPSVLLEQGIYAEQTAGDLDGAIRIYNRIVEEAEANRRYVAEAQYRLGACYLKKDQPDAARTAFEKLITEFPDRRDLIAKAREQMPARPFPEFVGCRIKHPVTLSLKPSGADPTTVLPAADGPNVPAYNLIELRWDLEAALAERVAAFQLIVSRKSGATGEPATLQIIDVGSDARSIVLPRPLSTSASEPAAGRDAWDLRPGAYTLVLNARGKDNGRSLLAVGTVHLEVPPLRYTQIMINDLGADGLIRFESIQQDVNTTAHEVKTKIFQNSDFVHVAGMYDMGDRPLKFTTQHIRDNYRYEVTFNEPIPAGQALLYRHEGTINRLVKRVADRKDEFEYLMQHHPGRNRPTRRIEVFRLPAGAELLETEPDHMAQRNKDGRVELFVDETVPPGGFITTQFRYRLVGATLADQKAFQLESVPWEDGEELSLKVKTSVGMDAGTFILTARKAKLDARDIWRLESWINVPVGDMQQYTRVDADAESFQPVTGLTHNSKVGTFQATYGPDKVVLRAEQDGKTQTREVPLKVTAYDNEQALQMLRRLPLAEGYHVRFPIFPVMGGSLIDCDIQVLDVQKVTVPAGTYPCYHIQLAVESGGVRALQHELWISADKHRYVVKYDEGTATMELTGVSKLKPGPTDFTDKEKSLSLTLPEGWRALRDASPSPYKYMVHLLSPELKTEALFVMNPREGIDGSAREIADQDVKVLAGFFEKYTVRDSDWANLQVDSWPAASYVADYVVDGRPMVEYRTYLLAESAVCWFVFRIEKQEFDAVRPALDGIVSSLRIKSAK